MATVKCCGHINFISLLNTVYTNIMVSIFLLLIKVKQKVYSNGYLFS